MARPALQPRPDDTTIENPLDGLDATASGLRSTAMEPLPPGTRLGDYTLGGLLGRGGSGHVYEASQECPRRQVALKVIASGQLVTAIAGRPQFEAEVLGRLRHPGIAQVFGSGMADFAGGTAWLAMELVQGGRPITAWAAGRGTRQIITAFIRVCEAVGHAHGRGVMHRDLKPGNVLVDDAGLPRLIDFGIAVPIEAGSASQSTPPLLAAGTPAYMSPEHFTTDLDDLDIRSDVYSLGVILYELLAGRLPHEIRGVGILEVARVVSETEPRPLPANVPRPLRAIVSKSLAKDRERRYASVADLANDLRRFLDGEPMVAVPPTAAETVAMLFRRHRARAIAAAVSLVAMTALCVTWANQRAAARLVPGRLQLRYSNRYFPGYGTGYLPSASARTGAGESLANSATPAVRSSPQSRASW
jgi:serine/threonine protein kinase